MHNVQEIFKECKAECAKCGIELGDIAQVDINYRAKRRWGYCQYAPDEGCYYIQVSDRLIQDTTPIRSLKETLLHEMCHTVDGGMCHTGEWRKAVEKLNSRYGYNIKRTSTSEEKGVPSQTFQRKTNKKVTKKCSKTYTVKYVFQCEKCKTRIERKRKSNFTEHPERYCCGGCGGMFQRVF